MQILYDFTFYKILLGTTLIAVTSGILGCFAFLKKQSLLGDTIAHATFPGLTGMFLIVLQKSYAFLLLGATISGLIGNLLIQTISQHTSLKQDTVLGIILSSFFGLGTVFLTIIQKIPNAHQAGLNKFIFGHASTLLIHDIIVLGIISFIVCLTTFFLWKELKIITFDMQYARTIGIAVNKVQTILTILMVLTIIVGLQTVGLILISSFLISPAIAARQWTSRLSSMVFLSIFFSLIATFLGTCISCSMPAIPTGPVIVILSTTITILSLIFGKQGIITQAIIQRRKNQNIKTACMLKNFMLFNESKVDPFHPHDLTALKVIGKKSNKKILYLLEQQGFITNIQSNTWQLTNKGLSKAQKLLAREQKCL